MTESPHESRSGSSSRRHDADHQTANLWATGASICLVGLVAIAPFLFGGTRPWTHAILGLIALVGLVLLIVARCTGASLGRLPFVALAAALVLSLVGVAQLVPLPPALVDALAPGRSASLRAYQPTDEAFGLPDETELRAVLSPVTSIPLSLAADATRREVVKRLLYLAVFVLSASLLARPATRRRLGWVIAATGTGLAVLGLVQHVTWNGRFFWLFPAPPGSHPYGPYVNRNHFSGFLELALPMTLALLLAAVILPRFRNRLLGIGIGAAGACAVPVAVLATSSRGGFLSASVGVLVFCVLSLRLRRARIPIAAFLIASIGFATYLSMIDNGQAFARLTSTGQKVLARIAVQEAVDAPRLRIWKTSLDMFRAYPIAGAGLGAYTEAYVRFKPAGIQSIASEAESDYLHLLAEGGVVSALPIVALFGLLAYAIARELRPARPRPRRSRRSADNPQQLEAWLWWSGAVAGVVSLLVHAVVDVNLHFSAANGALFIALGAIAIGGLNAHSVASTPSSRGTTLALATTAVAISCLAAVPLTRLLISDWNLEAARRAAWSDAPLAEQTQHLETSLRFDPRRAEAHYMLGEIYSGLALGGGRFQERMAHAAKGLRHLAEASMLRPTRSVHAFQLGWLAAAWGATSAPPSSALQSYGEQVLRTAHQLDPNIPSYLIRLGYYQSFVAANRLPEGLATIRQGLEPQPRTMLSVLGVLDRRLPRFLVSQAVPDTPEHRYQYALYLEQYAGSCADALEQYERALALASADPGVLDDYRRRIGNRLNYIGQLEEAYPLWVATIEEAPRDLGAMRGLALSLLGHSQLDVPEQLLREGVAVAQTMELAADEAMRMDLAWFLARYRGQRRDALEILPEREVSTTVFTFNRVSSLALASECLEATGNLGKAHRTLERLCDIEPDNSACEHLPDLERRMAQALARATVTQ